MNVKNDKLNVTHIPFSAKNPYQKLLKDGLVLYGTKVKGASIRHFLNISFLNLSLLSLLIKNWKPDIVHLHWQSSFLFVDKSRLKTIIKSFLFVFQLYALKLLGIKLVWTVHNLKNHEDTFRDLEFRFTKILIELSDGIIVHCQSAAEEIKFLFSSIRDRQISVIPHGHFSNYYSNKISRAEARKKLGLSSSRPTFLFFGEIRYYKGVLELVDTFKLLNQETSCLIIAGKPHDDKISTELRAKTSKSKSIKTMFTYIPDDELQIYINACDVMVFPYRNIFTSGSILLALSFGKPIIAPKIGCIKDILDDEGSFVYNPIDKNGLLNAMKLSIESEFSWDQMGLHNLHLAKHFDWKTISKQTLAVYKNVL